MCCFSQPVKSVSRTRIFARGLTRGRQVVVYSMKYEAEQQLAMILPLPVSRPAAENSVKFLNLKEYPSFFKDMEKGFPPPKPKLDFGGGFAGGGGFEEKPKLAVVDVGDYVASFVPTINDFGRLDEQYRIEPDVWLKLGDYKTYGFAVFQLKEKQGEPHPMAFEFLRANVKSLFFPTVHIHDGEVHPTADFDHVLYCQSTSMQSLRAMSWRESPQLARTFMKVDKTQDIVNGLQHCYRLELKGQLKNEDIRV